MAYEMTAEMEEAVITLIDERIEAATAPQTRRIDRLENALVQLADAQRRSEERQNQSLETQRHISHQMYTLTNAVNNLTNIVHTIQQTQVAMQGDLRTLHDNQRTMQGDIRRLDDRVSKLDDRVDKLDNKVAKLDNRVAKLDNRVAKLDNKVDKLDNKVEKLDNKVAKLDNRVAKLAGDSLEERYLKHAPAYLGRALRKAKAFKPYVMEDQLREKLPEADYEDLLLVDLLVRGIPKGQKGIHVWLAFEISVVVDQKDVERAVRRSEILRRAGFTGIPGVAGESLTQGAEMLADEKKVVVVTNGKMDHWTEALARNTRESINT